MMHLGSKVPYCSNENFSGYLASRIGLPWPNVPHLRNFCGTILGLESNSLCALHVRLLKLDLLVRHQGFILRFDLMPLLPLFTSFIRHQTLSCLFYSPHHLLSVLAPITVDWSGAKPDPDIHAVKPKCFIHLDWGRFTSVTPECRRMSCERSSLSHPHNHFHGLSILIGVFHTHHRRCNRQCWGIKTQPIPLE